nr:unnamed protein product [Callosobruchus chinensis]
MDTKFRKAIPVQDRLAITLRFLATGDSFTSLQYLFNVSKRISIIIEETCNALIQALKEQIKVTLNYYYINIYFITYVNNNFNLYKSTKLLSDSEGC